MKENQTTSISFYERLSFLQYYILQKRGCYPIDVPLDNSLVLIKYNVILFVQ